MNDVFILLRPRYLSIKNGRLSKHAAGGAFKLILLGGIGAIFWAAVFAVSLRVLDYFKHIEEIGDIISFKLLSMLLITAFSLLIFSSILTALSKLYLSRDLFLVHALPVSSYKIFLARWIDSTVESSWMVNVYLLPVFISYGIVFEKGIFYYLVTVASILSLSIIASSVSAIVIMCAVIVIPASRMKSIFILLGILLFIVLYIAFRMLKPELLVDPEVFADIMIYIKTLQTPSSPFLPSTWTYDCMTAALLGKNNSAVFHLTLSWSCAGVFIFVNIWVADLLYFKGMSKTQTAGARFFKSSMAENSIFDFMPGPVKAFTIKEIKTFFRDQTQWTQLFLIGALVVIYIYNFKVLPLEKSPIPTVYLQNLFSFLNMGLALFVLTAITARFAYPAVSTEGEAFWIVKNGPIPLKTFIRIKFIIYCIPLLVLTEILIVATNILLKVSPMIMILSTVTVFCMTPGIVSLGIGFGAAYPDFSAENPMQTVTSFGGILFMILSAGYIGAVILLEAGPVYHLFMANLKGIPLSTLQWIWLCFSFGLAFILAVAALILPLKFGEKRLAGRYR